MTEKMDKSFESAVNGLSRRLAPYCRTVPFLLQQQVWEIRLRLNRPVAFTCGGRTRFLTQNGIAAAPGPDCVTARREDMEETFQNICDYSVHSCQNQIKNGFITLKGGHRAGICGTAVYSGGEFSGIRDVSSINLRVARQIRGAADCLLSRMDPLKTDGILIAGPPSSGKTTILRDLACRLSTNWKGSPLRVAVVDERGELAGTWHGQSQNDLGPCCDVLDGYPKGEGILQAVRALFPQVVLCDELGGMQEVSGIEEGLHAGVRIIATAHAGGEQDLRRRPQVQRLLQTQAFETVVLLAGEGKVGEIAGIYKAGELLGQDDWANMHRGGGRGRGVCGIPPAFGTRQSVDAV